MTYFVVLYVQAQININTHLYHNFKHLVIKLVIKLSLSVMKRLLIQMRATIFDILSHTNTPLSEKQLTGVTWMKRSSIIYRDDLFFLFCYEVTILIYLKEIAKSNIFTKRSHIKEKIVKCLDSE